VRTRASLELARFGAEAMSGVLRGRI
jgi:hypothetical protein